MKKLSQLPYKGTRDFYPQDMAFQRWMFEKLRKAVQSFGYEEYGGPMLEPFEIYAAKTGEEIVSKQLFWLEDQAQRKMVVRPEMTPTLARMVSAKLHELPKPIRWFSFPNLWRYERPQRGRLREHWQLNVDLLGGEPLMAHMEIFKLIYALLKEFQGEDKIRIHINHRELVNVFLEKKVGLNQQKITSTLKIIDKKKKISQEAFQELLKKEELSDSQIEKLNSFFTMSFSDIVEEGLGKSSEELKVLFERLKSHPVSEVLKWDPSIVRGVDYYTGLVFEIYDISQENHRAMFGGGRYDDLIGVFSKDSLSGVGFGMGDVTFQNFLETHKSSLPSYSHLDILVTLPSSESYKICQEICEELRKTGFRVNSPLEEASFGKQLKLAHKLKARYAILLGEEELSQNKVTVKDLKSGKQSLFDIKTLKEDIKTLDRASL